MKANLIALFCIILFVLSVPQAFAEDTNTIITKAPTVEENPTQIEAPEPIKADPAPVGEQLNVEPTKPATADQEQDAVESDAGEEAEAKESKVPAPTEAQKKEDDANNSGAGDSVDGTQSVKETATVATETAPADKQDSTEEVEDDESKNGVVPPPAVNNTVEDDAANIVAQPKETPKTDEPAVVPTETPNSTNTTNAEPLTPAAEESQETVPAAEESQETVPAAEESQETVPAAEESQETAPAAESEEQVEKKDGLSLFGLISKVLVGLGILSVVILVGCVYHYRYQMQKYKIAPFTPPSFLPECLFPRNTESSGRLISGYTELQVGNYQSAPRFAQV